MQFIPVGFLVIFGYFNKTSPYDIKKEKKGEEEGFSNTLAAV